MGCRGLRIPGGGIVVTSPKVEQRKRWLKSTPQALEFLQAMALTSEKQCRSDHALGEGKSEFAQPWDKIRNGWYKPFLASHEKKTHRAGATTLEELGRPTHVAILQNGKRGSGGGGRGMNQGMVCPTDAQGLLTGWGSKGDHLHAVEEGRVH